MKCLYCQRAPRAPHAMNCPTVTGVLPQSDTVRPHKTKRKTGAYLRRGRNSGKPFPQVIYLVETREPEPDTPAAFYRESTVSPIEHCLKVRGIA